VTLKVRWPYITLKVRSDTAGTVLREFYAGATVPDNADPDDRDRLVRKGAIGEDAEPAAEPTAKPAAPSAALERPAGNASQAAWLDYAVANRPDGMSEEDAIDAYGSKTRAELVAEFGG
jgi:hypothetical protein